ncbi:MAG: ABC transporter permease [Chloroflexota bacterium]
MIKRLFISLQRDSWINWRNGFVAVTLAVALIYLALVRWLIPADVSLEPAFYVLDQTGDGRFAQLIGHNDDGSTHLVTDLNALQAALAANDSAVGLHLTDGVEMPQATLYFQRHQGERVRNLAALAIDAQLAALYGVERETAVTTTTHVLQPDSRPAPIPFNLLWVPILLFSDAAMIGLLFIAALIFAEKEEGTLRAYLVTPGRIWEYLLSKAVTLGLLAVAFTLIFVPATVGAGPNYLYLVALMLLAGIATSLLGAWMAVYFDNISQFLLPAISLIIVLGLPAVSYFNPSFSPLWLRLLPTYPLIFGMREAIFPSGSPQIVYTALLVLLLLSAVSLVAGSIAFDKQLARR